MKNEQGLLIATGNAGKVAEMTFLLRNIPFTFRGLSDFPGIVDVDETGSTYEENAVLKARGYSQQTDSIALADDSGLEIEALGNAPGVLSARYAGNETPFGEKIALLLAELAKTGDDDRKARFVCSMALADPRGRTLITSTGICEGTIALEPSGLNGFGYDPIFVPNGHRMTFGELTDQIKHEISHRARASRTIIRYLLDFMAV
jgi:XTP/dITP diphosphohydrolase